MPSAAAIDAIRTPIDLPPARTRRPRAPATPSANASRHASTSTGARSGALRPARMYGNSKRSVATPRRPAASANPVMKGVRMPDPAPCASTTTTSAPGGSIHMPGLSPLRDAEAPALGPVAVGPLPREVVRLTAAARLRDGDRVRLRHLEVVQDLAHRLLVASHEVLVHDRQRLDLALAEVGAPLELVRLDFADQVRDGGVAVDEVAGADGGLLMARPAPGLQRPPQRHRLAHLVLPRHRQVAQVREHRRGQVAHREP